MKTLRVAGVQLNPTVGDIAGNVTMIREEMGWAESQGADVLLLPELAVTGYPPEDLVLRDSFVAASVAGVDRLAADAGEMVTVVGFVDRAEPEPTGEDAVDRVVANAAALLGRGRIAGIYHKILLPNYGVFDEARYFEQGRDPAMTWSIADVCVGVSICEDIWTADGPPMTQAAAGARVLLNINGSPYHVGKSEERSALLSEAARRTQAHVVYLNMVGGQDELVFDGESMVFAPDGSLVYRAAQFAPTRFVLDLPVLDHEVPAAAIPIEGRSRRGHELIDAPPTSPRLGTEEAIYDALVLGLRDYVHKNGFRQVVIGLSGGIDSALTCAIAVDALGAEAVWGVSMPARYSSVGSVEDSRDLADRLGCRFDVVDIDNAFGAHLAALGPLFAGTESGVAEENLQARIRGAMLMALSNKYGGMVVATGNKSEMAVGYATLYGDMAGGYSVLKDVFKTRVYELARWRNERSEVIPRAILDKPPSAELRPDQLDADSLPDYAVLDAILERYVERDESAQAIVAEGLSEAIVARVTTLVDRNEYKRRQAAPGVRITSKAFGKDRRLPITNGFRSGS
jgi:NAD+ synthase (glutamine-hydrolysing)